MEYAAVSDAAIKRIPDANIIVRVLRLPSKDTPAWAVLSTTGEAKYRRPIPSLRMVTCFTEISNIRVSIFRGRADCPELTWQSKVLGNPASDFLYREVQLELMDLTNDGNPEVLVIESEMGKYGKDRVHADVFSWREGVLKKILGVNSEYEILFRDIDGNGKYSVISSRRIGYGLPIWPVPKWIDIYSYKQGVYQLSNGDFPREYDSILKEIRHTQKKAPENAELLLYLGRIYEIQRKPASALMAYRRSLVPGYKHLAKAKLEKNPLAIARTKRIVDEAERRIELLFATQGQSS